MRGEPKHGHDIERASTTEGLPVAPSMLPGLEVTRVPRQAAAVNGRVVAISGIACFIAVAAALVAQLLTRLIFFITNLAFLGRVSFEPASPAENHLGFAVIAVPVVGAIIVGIMARFGSQAIRGHGIPEAMEQVLFNQSRIPARMTFLKPLSAVVSIGTGGPFGAEGPIIATGGAFGSLVGQFIKITAEERKTLLSAGAAAGMAATFGSPVAAVLLAIELLLFEYRPRSVIPVALASVTATGVRVAFVGTAPAFAVSDIGQPPFAALGFYTLLGAVIGLASVAVTKAIYAIEDGFERLPIHWMWWPAIGAIPVGIIGIIAPRTMGVGYDNIEQMVSGTLAGKALAVLCIWKLISWALSLGSGTSGGTLAPLFTIGGGLGATCAAAIAGIAPSIGIDPRIGALVGMAAMFAGASHALLASVVFAFETTRQPLGLLPLLGGCTAAYLVSCILMKHSIMTEKLARRGVRVPSQYAADFLEQVLVRDVAVRNVVTLSALQTVGEAKAWIGSGVSGTTHQGFPVIDGKERFVGLVTRRDLFDGRDDGEILAKILRHVPVAIHPEASLREAADMMVSERVGRLPVLLNGKIIGIVTRSDLLDAHQRRLAQETKAERSRSIPFISQEPSSPAQ